MTKTLANIFHRHPALNRRLDDFWALVGGVSVRTKILGIVLALTVTLGLGVTLQVRGVMTETLLAELDNRGQAVASDLAGRSLAPLSSGDRTALRRLLLDTITNHPDARYAFVITPAGQVLAHTFVEAVPAELLFLDPSEAITHAHHIHYENYEGQMHDFAMSIQNRIPDGDIMPNGYGSQGVVRLGLVETRLQAIIDQVTLRMLLTTLLVALAGVLAASLLTWLLTRPILDLVAATQRLRQGDLSVRAPRWTDDEIGALADAFNQMVGELEASRQIVAEKEAARTRLLSQLINAQEEERKRIARDLHDEVGQALTSLLVGLKLLRQPDDRPALQAKTAELRQVAAGALEAVRLLSRQLRPSALDDLGLAAALERYLAEFSSRYPDLSLDLHCDLPARLPAPVETSLYRIIQEAMTNAARHSQAGALSVLVTQRNGQVQAIIEDDGRGFDPTAARRSGRSVGLHGMAERAELLGGRLQIESSQEGSTVYVEIPL